MYENAGSELKKILELVETCPEQLRNKAFEILLQGYVSTLISKNVSVGMSAPPKALEIAQVDRNPQDLWREGIPDEVLPRFMSMASRIKAKPERLANIFDFSTDPFTFSAVHVEGKSTRERALRVAMLVAARAYLATGRWAADWAEIKAMCIHQNCYDVNNFASTLNAAQGDWFKKVISGSTVQPSSKGQQESERILAELAGGLNASEE